MLERLRRFLASLRPAPETVAPLPTIKEVAAQLGRERRLKRLKDADPAYAEAVFIRYFGREPPQVLREFYAERIESITGCPCVYPTRRAYEGGDFNILEYWVNELQGTDFVPLFDDVCGNIWALDLSGAFDPPAVYFFDHEQDPDTQPSEVSASSLPRFLLVLARTNQLYDEADRNDGRSPLHDSLGVSPLFGDAHRALLHKIDPDLESLKRARREW